MKAHPPLQALNIPPDYALPHSPAAHRGPPAQRKQAIEHARIAGCVCSVSLSCSSGPWKHSAESENPRARSASSKTAPPTAYRSASSRPMPGDCDPCPGNRKANGDMRSRLPYPKHLTRSTSLKAMAERLEDASHSLLRSCVHDCAPFVVATMRAYLMRQFLFMTVGTFAQWKRR